MIAFNIEVEGGKSVKLPTGGKYCDRDIVVTASGGDGSYEEGYEKGKTDGVAEGIEQGYNNGFADGVNSVEPVYESASGVLYKKNTVINSENAIPLTTNNYYENAEYLETFNAPNANKWSGYYTFRNETKLKSVCAPKVTSVASYMPFFGVDNSGSLEELQIGSVGYPVTNIQYALIGTNNLPTTITIYVADDAIIPLSGTPWNFAGATIIYRSATTGEVITV